MVNQMVDGVSRYALLALPFFFLIGEIMSAGGIYEKIVDFANLLVGRFRGGLAYVNCLDSMFFGGISGSAVADVSSLGSVVVPMMDRQGYTPEFSVALTVTTSCQGVLIPPSHNMVIYAWLPAAWPARQYRAPFDGRGRSWRVPGPGFDDPVLFMPRGMDFPEGLSSPREKRLKVLLHAVLPLLTLVIIMGGVAVAFSR